MSNGLRKSALKAANSVLRVGGLELVRSKRSFQDYISLKETLTGAENAGTSIGEYIETRSRVPGSTRKTIDEMAALGVFESPVRRICEIGPGSGRYLEIVLDQCQPDRYEIYETADEWREWLAGKYSVTPFVPGHGTLPFTPDASIDLLHTHKMLYGNPIITICSYFFEMARVVAAGGWLVFDILTEACLSDELVEKWIQSMVDHASSMTGKQFAVDFFTGKGFVYRGGFTIPLSPGITEYLVFQKSMEVSHNANR